MSEASAVTVDHTRVPRLTSALVRLGLLGSAPAPIYYCCSAHARQQPQAHDYNVKVHMPRRWDIGVLLYKFSKGSGTLGAGVRFFTRSIRLDNIGTVCCWARGQTKNRDQRGDCPDRANLWKPMLFVSLLWCGQQTTETVKRPVVRGSPGPAFNQ